METGIESREDDRGGGGGGGQHWAPPKHLLQAGEVPLTSEGAPFTQNHWCANRTAAVTPKCRRTHSPTAQVPPMVAQTSQPPPILLSPVQLSCSMLLIIYSSV